MLKYRYWIIIILILMIGGLASFAAYSKWQENASEIQSGQEDWLNVKGRLNILLLGTDEKLGTQTRTDSIILASLDTKNKKISLLSIPRDTRVNIPGFGENKINSANQLGGIKLVEETISNLIKVPIDYYVITNFEGFKNIVDTLGGVEIDVEQNMKDRVYDGMINIKKGQQRLNGEKALQYVRFRHDKLGDISRTQRQQKFLSALAKEMIQAKNIVKLPVLIPELNKAVKTDLPITKMISLAKDFGKYDLSSITVQTLPGNFVNINGGSYWCVDQEKAHQVVLEVFAGKSGDIIDSSVKVDAGTPKSVETKKPKLQTTSPQVKNQDTGAEGPPEDNHDVSSPQENQTGVDVNVPGITPDPGNESTQPPEEPNTDNSQNTDENNSNNPGDNQNTEPVVIPGESNDHNSDSPLNPENNLSPENNSQEETSQNNMTD